VKLCLDFTSLLSLTAKVTLPFENSVTELIWLQISHGLWPLQYPYLTSYDFYWWESLKDKVYKTNPRTLEELRYDIRSEISTVSGEELHIVSNIILSFNKCIWLGQQHFQHLLWHWWDFVRLYED